VHLDELRSETIQLTSGVTALRYIRAGKQLDAHVKFAANSPKSRVTVYVTAKADGDGPFQGACGAFSIPTTWGAGEETVVHASANISYSPTLIWRIEVVQDPPLPLNLPPLGVQLNLSSTKPQTGAAATVSDSEYLCLQQGGKRIAGSPSIAPNSFSGSTRLAVAVEDESHALSPAAMSELESDVLSAIETWRLVCRNCNADNLSVAQVDGHRYLLAAIVAAFRSPDPATYNMPPLQQPKYSGLFLDLNWRSGGRGVVQQHFMRVEDTDPAIVRLCAEKPADLPIQIKRIQAAVGCLHHDHPDPSEVESAHLRVRAVPGFTDCGEDKNIIACENGSVAVALNVRDYAFVDENANVLFGAGMSKVALMHVVLHEVGHWIGLGHINSWGNIMSPSMSDSRCIDLMDGNAVLSASEGTALPPAVPLAFYDAPADLAKRTIPIAPEVPLTPEQERLRNTPAHFKVTSNPEAK
jgi:hypothetical protein